MKLLHHQEVELSRSLLATLPAGTEVIDCSVAPPEGINLSAYPSVVVTIPAAEYEAPMYGPNGELLGVAWTGHDEYEEVIRMPISWEAVDQYVALKLSKQTTPTTVEEQVT